MSNLQEIAGDALTYLAQTDEPVAEAKSRMVGLSAKVKIVLAQQFLVAGGKSATEKKFIAEASEPYAQVVEDHANAVLDYETLNAKRATQHSRFEWCRSLNASRRMGGGNV